MDLNSELIDLITLGESWGMSQAEIKACLQAELSNEGKNEKRFAQAHSSSTTSSSTTSYGAFSVVKVTLWRCVTAIVILPILLMVLLVMSYTLLTTAAAMFPPVEYVLGKVAQPYMYSAMRPIRMIFKPYVDTLDIAGRCGGCLTQ